MRDNAPVFVVIGKPNNGKSSIISALTMDDRVEVGANTGTTTKAQSYSYVYQEKIICTFYDTPGFEMAKYLWKFIQTQQSEHRYGNSVFRDFIHLHKEEESFVKDTEILEAIMKSDFLIFVVDISVKPNINQMGAELKIIQSIDKPKVIFFNQIEKQNYEQEWREFLSGFSLENICRFDPIKNNIHNIRAVFTQLYSIDEELANKKYLDTVLKTHKMQFEQNLHLSVGYIAQTLLEILQYTYTKKVSKSEITQSDKEAAAEAFIENISKIEHKLYDKIKKQWGYYKAVVVDKRVRFDAKENIELGLTPSRLMMLGAASGGGVGALFAPFDGGISVLVGASVGMAGAYLVKEKLYSVVISKKKISYSIGKKDFNTTIILLSRMLQHLQTIIQHGHANRDAIVIDDLQKMEFSSEDEKFLLNVHRSFTQDKNTQQMQQELEVRLLKLLQSSYISELS